MKKLLILLALSACKIVHTEGNPGNGELGELFECRAVMDCGNGPEDFRRRECAHREDGPMLTEETIDLIKAQGCTVVNRGPETVQCGGVNQFGGGLGTSSPCVIVN